MAASQINVKTVVSEMFMENAYIAHLDSSSQCVVVDPGLDPDAIIARVERDRLVPVAILITHGHADHIAGVGAIKQRWPDCRVIIGQDEAEKLVNPRENLSASFGFAVTSPPADTTVVDEETFEAADIPWRVRHVPGHSRGHVVYIAPSGNGRVAFVGDVIFAGSVGRTDLPGGDFAQLAAGIRDKLYTLPDDTSLYSGHGPPTTVGREKTTNPFVRMEADA